MNQLLGHYIRTPQTQAPDPGPETKGRTEQTQPAQEQIRTRKRNGNRKQQLRVLQPTHEATLVRRHPLNAQSTQTPTTRARLNMDPQAWQQEQVSDVTGPVPRSDRDPGYQS